MCSAVWVTGGAGAASSSSSFIIQTNTNSYALAFFLHLLCLSAMAVGHVSGALDMNRELEGQRQDRMVEWSLVDVAAHYAERQGVLIYYCGQWSIKSRT